MENTSSTINNDINDNISDDNEDNNSTSAYQLTLPQFNKNKKDSSSMLDDESENVTSSNNNINNSRSQARNPKTPLRDINSSPSRDNIRKDLNKASPSQSDSIDSNAGRSDNNNNSNSGISNNPSSSDGYVSCCSFFQVKNLKLKFLYLILETSESARSREAT
jgi:hypothetical protein